MEFSLQKLFGNRAAIIVIAAILGIFLLCGGAFLIFPEVRDSGAPILRVEGIEENARFSKAYTITYFAEDKETRLTNAEIAINEEHVYTAKIQNALYTGRTEISLAGLTEGEHILSVTVYDNALFRHKTESQIRFWIDRTPPAVQIQLNSNIVKQGDTLAVYLDSNEEFSNAFVVFKNRTYPIDPMDEDLFIYAAYIPVSVFNAIQQEPLICQFSDIVGNTAEEQILISVKSGIFEKEWIEVPQGKTVIFATSNDDRRQREAKIIAQAYATHTPKKFWEKKFLQPTEGWVSSSFATQRIYSTGGIASYHKGIDIANRTSPLIFASNFGNVILAREFLVYGNMVMIDHGNGIITMYGHMKKLLVSEGDFVLQKQALGIMGDTGLATGPHLHWEMRINGREVNPLQWENTDLEHPWKEAF